MLQLEQAGRELLARLATQAPLLPDADVLAFTGTGSTQSACGHKKQGARFGRTKIQGKSVLVRGLNALITAVSTPLSAPVMAATRLRGGSAPSARGAKGLAAQAIGTARACGCFPHFQSPVIHHTISRHHLRPSDIQPKSDLRNRHKN